MRRTRSCLGIATGLTILLAVVASGCSGSGGGQEAATAAADGMAPAGGATEAPGFELPSIDGESVQLSDSAGKVRLIDFWATWCPPCRDEIPMLNELHAKYRDEGLTILAISDEKADVIREFADEIEMRYTNLVDSGDVTASYRVRGLPTAFLIDRDGRIVESYMGPKPRKMLEKKIRELLELPPA